VYVAFSDGHVVAYDVNSGQEKWPPVDLAAEAEATASESVRYLDVDTTPIVTGPLDAPVVHVASYAGGVFALDGRSGARIWANDRAIGVTELALFEEPAHVGRDGLSVAASQILLASSASSGLWALDMQGRELWRNKVPDGGITRPVGCAGTLVVGTSKHGLMLLSPRTGQPIDGIDPGSGFSQVPKALGNRLFALSNGGILFGMEVVGPRRHTSNVAPILR
jgi:outer membrane protein assembly factor BamB